jgi:hypothetical protein
MQARRCQVFVEKNDLLVETEGRYIRVEIVGSRDTELIQIIFFFLLLTLRLKILSIVENKLNKYIFNVLLRNSLTLF